jgi:hypothetical protein
MKRIKSAVIAGKRWKFDWTRPPPEDGAIGETHWDLRTLQIDPANPNTADFLDTVIHETTHAAAPYLSGEGVETISNAIAGVLWKVGYRCV